MLHHRQACAYCCGKFCLRAPQEALQTGTLHRAVAGSKHGFVTVGVDEDKIDLLDGLLQVRCDDAKHL